MYVTSRGLDAQGFWQDQYGKRGTQFGKDRMPSYSLPFQIHEAPEGTKSFAVVFEDKDAVPVCGFVWIHWLVANLTQSGLDENESIAPKTHFVQGVNSWYGGHELTTEEASFYGGMAPPNAPHCYELIVYALDETLPLEKGFFYNELHHAMEGHILATAVLKGMYRN